MIFINAILTCINPDSSGGKHPAVLSTTTRLYSSRTSSAATKQ